MTDKNLALRKAVNFAIANNEIEGHKFTEEEKADLEKIACGEMTFEELIEKTDRKFAQYRIDHPGWFASEDKPSNFEVEHQDPLCYIGTHVLINKVDTTDYQKLQEFERLQTVARQGQLIINPVKGNLGLKHLLEIHGHLFQDVYNWAGQVRTCYLSKPGTNFCYPQHINSAANEIFIQLKKDNYFQGLDFDKFSEKVGALWGDINHLHPFREGNGRSTREFLREVALNANYELNLDGIDPAYMVYASRESISGNNKELTRIIKGHITSIDFEF